MNYLQFVRTISNECFKWIIWRIIYVNKLYFSLYNHIYYSFNIILYTYIVYINIALYINYKDIINYYKYIKLSYIYNYNILMLSFVYGITLI